MQGRAGRASESGGSTVPQASTAVSGDQAMTRTSAQPQEGHRQQWGQGRQRHCSRDIDTSPARGTSPAPGLCRAASLAAPQLGEGSITVSFSHRRKLWHSITKQRGLPKFTSAARGWQWATNPCFRMCQRALGRGLGPGCPTSPHARLLCRSLHICNPPDPVGLG